MCANLAHCGDLQGLMLARENVFFLEENESYLEVEI